MVTLQTLINSEIIWTQKSRDNRFIFIANCQNLFLQLAINDFPDHPFIYSFTSEVGLFDSLDLPAKWQINQPT